MISRLFLGKQEASRLFSQRQPDLLLAEIGRERVDKQKEKTLHNAKQNHDLELKNLVEEKMNRLLRGRGRSRLDHN